MKTVNRGGWVFYYSTVVLSNLDDNKVGKWIIFLMISIGLKPHAHRL